MRRIRVLLADDHHLFRQGLAHLLSAQEDLEVVAEAGDAGEAIDQALEVRPDLILIDISMPGLPSFEAVRKI